MNMHCVCLVRFIGYGETLREGRKEGRLDEEKVDLNVLKFAVVVDAN